MFLSTYVMAQTVIHSQIHLDNSQDYLTLISLSPKYSFVFCRMGGGHQSIFFCIFLSKQNYEMLNVNCG